MELINEHTEIRKVLIIDDCEIDRYVIKKLMERNNFSKDIITASSCKEGLQYLSKECVLAENLPDFIFLDLFMPVETGYDFLKIYSKRSQILKKKCRLVILSVLINEENAQVLLNNPDVYTLLQKPINEESINALKELYSLESSPIRKVIGKQSKYA